MQDLIRNPEDRLSHNAAHFQLTIDCMNSSGLLKRKWSLTGSPVRRRFLLRCRTISRNTDNIMAASGLLGSCIWCIKNNLPNTFLSLSNLQMVLKILIKIHYLDYVCLPTCVILNTKYRHVKFSKKKCGTARDDKLLLCNFRVRAAHSRHLHNSE